MTRAMACMRFPAFLAFALVVAIAFDLHGSGVAMAQNRPAPSDTSSGSDTKGPSAERKKKICDSYVDAAASYLRARDGLVCTGLNGPSRARCNLQRSSLWRSYINAYDRFLDAGCATATNRSFPRS